VTIGRKTILEGGAKSNNTLKNLGKIWKVTKRKKIKINEIKITCLDMIFSKQQI